jgi:hypothetical protein
MSYHQWLTANYAELCADYAELGSYPAVHFSTYCEQQYDRYLADKYMTSAEAFTEACFDFSTPTHDSDIPF